MTPMHGVHLHVSVTHNSKCMAPHKALIKRGLFKRIIVKYLIRRLIVKYVGSQGV